MSKSKIFLAFCVVFILGVFFGKYINYEIMAVMAMIFIILGTVWFQNKTIFILSIAGVVALAGAIRFKTDFAKNDIAQYYNQTVEVVGLIVEEPDVRTDKTYLTLGKIEINGRRLDSKILVNIPKYREFEYGEKFRFVEKIQEPKEYPDFSYKNYLSRFGIDAVVYQPKIESIEGNYGNKFKFWILQTKKKFTETLTEVLIEPQNSLLGGLLLGAKRSIPESLTEQFNKTGMSHIVAVSGYNITIIALGIGWLLQRLGLHKRISFFVSIPVIILFVIMIGASASAVRAGIMGILLLLAFNVGRLSVAANSLAFTASVMIALNPQILAFDVGFQLSFAALIGIVYLIPILEPYFSWMPIDVRKYFLATLSAQTFALPLLLYYFGTLSLIAILPNLLILPMIPITMLFGFLTGITGLVWIKLSLPFAYVTKLLLSYILGIIGFFASLPFASISWQISFYIMLIYYLIIGGIIVWYYRVKSLQNQEILLEYVDYDHT
jgi:competence protein ComEC